MLWWSKTPPSKLITRCLQNGVLYDLLVFFTVASACVIYDMLSYLADSLHHTPRYWTRWEKTRRMQQKRLENILKRALGVWSKNAVRLRKSLSFVVVRHEFRGNRTVMGLVTCFNDWPLSLPRWWYHPDTLLFFHSFSLSSLSPSAFCLFLSVAVAQCY